MRLASLLLVAVLVGGCAAPNVDPGTPSPGPDRPSASESATAPTPSPSESPTGPAYSTWELGAEVLPLRPDGFGEVRPTPPSLRMRRYPTADLLHPTAASGRASTRSRPTYAAGWGRRTRPAVRCR